MYFTVCVHVCVCVCVCERERERKRLATYVRRTLAGFKQIPGPLAGFGTVCVGMGEAAMDVFH